MSFDAGSVNAKLTLDRTPFNRDLFAAKAEAAKFEAMTTTATADLNTSPAYRKAAELRGFLGVFSTETIDIDTNVNTDQSLPALGRLKDSLHDAGGESESLRGDLHEMDAALRVAATGGIIALVGALGPLTGVTLAAGSAVVGLGGALGLLGLAIFPTISALSNTNATLTDTQQALKDTGLAFRDDFLRQIKPANDAVNMLGIEMINLGRTALPAIAAASYATVLSFSSSIHQLMAELTTPAQLTIFQGFLTAMPGIMGSATSAAGRLAFALFNIFAVPINSGLVQQMLIYVDDLIGRFLAWTQSVEGQNAIYDFFQTAVPVAQALAIAVGQIATGLGTLITSGVAQQLAVNIATLLGTIGDNLPVFLPFVYAMNALLTVFNNLPGPLQSVIIGFFALNTVLGLLGLGSIFSLAAGLTKLWYAGVLLRALGLPTIFGGIGTAIAGMASTIAFWLEWIVVITIPEFIASLSTFFAVTIPAAIGAGLGPIALVLGTLLGSWYYILGPAGLIVAVLLGFVAFIAGGWVLLVIAAVASAAIAIAVAIYRNWDSIKIAAQSLVDWWGTLPVSMQAAFTAALIVLNPVLGIAAAIATVYDWLTSNGSASLTSWFGSLPGWLQSAFITGLSEANIFSGLIDSITSLVDWLGAGGLDSIVAWFTNLPGMLYNGIVSSIQANPLFDPIVNAVKSLLEWGKQLWESFKSMGANMINGLLAGIGSLASKIWHAVVDPIVNAYNAAKSWLQSASPSKRFQTLGETMPQGLAEGAMRGVGLAEKAGAAIASAAERGFGLRSPVSVGSSSGASPIASSLGRRGRRRRQQPIIIHNYVMLDGKEMKNWTNETTHENLRSSSLSGDYLGGL